MNETTQQTRQPNFFIIGAPKSGTTAMAHYLSEHPNVFFSAPKEPFFWVTDHPGIRETHQLHTLDDYLKLYQGADPSKHTAIGEGSTTYLQSHVAVKNIVEFQPEAKFIVMLRNPVDVAHGMHGELIRHFAETEPDFEKAWHLQAERANGKHLPKKSRLTFQLQYQDVASYAPQLKRLFQHVPESRRRVIIFDDFIRNTQRSYQETLQFLNLKDDGRQEFPKVNAAGKYRFSTIGRLYQAPPVWLGMPIRLFRKWYSKQNGRLRNFVHSVVQKQAPREELAAEFREQLKRTFENDVAETSQLLQRDLGHWTRSLSLKERDKLTQGSTMQPGTST